MSMFNQLPGFERTPAGLERVILRRMPRAFLLSALVPALAALLARWFDWSGSEAAVAASIQLVDFVAIGSVLLCGGTIALISRTHKGEPLPALPSDLTATPNGAR